MNTSDIGLAFINFSAQTGGKKRPVLIIGKVADNYLAFSITSKFASKSVRIQAIYYPIQDWKKAGLNYPSWVDTGHVLYLNQNRYLQKIGQLMDRDKASLIQFLAERHAL